MAGGRVAAADVSGLRTRARRVAAVAARRAGLRPSPPIRRKNGRIAFVGPMPPAPTGIATYDRAVLDGLARIGFPDRRPIDVLWPIRKEHRTAIRAYDLAIYQLGNHVEHHREVYRLAWSSPGLVVLHDLALDDFVRGLQSLGDPLGFRALGEAVGARHRSGPSSVRDAEEPLAVPWCAAAARAARGVIVHSEFGRRYLEGIGCRTPVFVVPHPVVEPPAALALAEAGAGELRARLGAGRLIVAPGDVNATKLHGTILAALARLPADVHLVIVGRRAPGYDVARLVERHGVRDRVTVALDVPDAAFLGWLAAADVVVDLRHPHRGEVSGSLARAMQAGKPTVVSAVGTYRDLPDDTVVRVPAGRVDPEVLRATLLGLLDDPARGGRVGDAAAAHVRRLVETEATAHGYEAAILATRSLLLDPAHAVMARWARGLAEIGVDDALVAEGFGLSYVRALEGFTKAR